MKRFWNFKSSADGEGVELRIEGEIVSDDDAWFYEWFGIPVANPSAFKEELFAYKGKDITVWIDSWGGDVFAAAGMYNALKEHKGKVVVKIDGKAASAGSVIAMAGDEVYMSPVSILMIHNPWSGTRGEAKDMRHMADVLDEVKQTLINAYQLKTGLSANKISRLMDEETWMSAKKAVAQGFANGILYADDAVPKEADPEVQDSFMFSRMAIQNSVSLTMDRFAEQYNRIKQQPAATEANHTSTDPERAPSAPLSLFEKQLALKGRVLNS